jgi:hypothetical protein
MAPLVKQQRKGLLAQFIEDEKSGTKRKSHRKQNAADGGQHGTPAPASPPPASPPPLTTHMCAWYVWYGRRGYVRLGSLHRHDRPGHVPHGESRTPHDTHDTHTQRHPSTLGWMGEAVLVLTMWCVCSVATQQQR